MTTNRMNRRADDFDAALSGTATKIDPATAALVALAGALAATPQRPAPAFRDALRAKLMTEAASIAASAPAASAPAAAGPHGLAGALAHPAMQVATGALAATIAVTGVGVGASRSLPGDALYGLKRTVEGWQVGLSGGPNAEAAALLEHVQTRLDEVRALLDHGDLNEVAGTLEALDTELHRAVTRLLAQARAGSREAYDELSARLDGLSRQLLALMSQVPVQGRPALFSAMQTLNVTRVELQLITPPPVVTPTPSTHPPTGPSTSPSQAPPTSGPPVTPPTSLPVTPPTSLPVTPPTSLPVTPPVSVPISVPVSIPPLAP